MKEKAESDSKTAARKFEARCGWLFTRVMMVLLPLLVLDYVSSIFWPHRRSEVERKFPVQTVRHPAPYTMFGGVKNGQLGRDIVLNGRGYRGKEPSMPKPADEFRVFVLGGSTVFVGHPPICDYVEAEFRKHGNQNIQLYNYGVVSSVSSMELSRIVHEISDLTPDLIVMYNGGNDILHPYEYDPRPGYPFNFIVYENNPLLESNVRSYPRFSLLLYGSNMARLFFPRYFVRRFVPMSRERKNAGWGTDAWEAQIARRYVANLVKAEQISATFGAGFIAFFQPMVYYKDPRSAEEEEECSDPVLAKHCQAVRERVLEQTRLIRSESSPLPIDLSDIYDDVPTTVFIDEIHTKQEAMITVAKAIYEHMQKVVEIEHGKGRQSADDPVRTE